MEKATMTIRINSDLHKWLKSESEKRGISVNAMISFLLSEYKQKQERSF